MSKRRKKKPASKREKLEVTVRPVTDETAEAAFDLVRKYHAERPDKCHEGFDARAVGALVAKIIVGREHAALLAFNGSKTPIGLALVYGLLSHSDPAVKCGQSLAFWVAPEVRGRGVDDALVASATDWARERDIKILTFSVPKGCQEEARKFLNSGFRLAESSYVKRL